MLFNRSGTKCTRNNIGQNFRFIVKRTVSDQMIEICNFYDDKFVEYEDFISIKHLIDEKDIYNLSDEEIKDVVDEIDDNN